MLFLDAVKEMKNRKFMKRVAWTVDKGYRMIFPGNHYIYAVVNVLSQPQVQWAPLPIEDLEANDWVEVTASDLVIAVPEKLPVTDENEPKAA
jgi:hypothetical protein